LLENSAHIFGKDLTKFDTPLIEAVNAIDETFNNDSMLIQR